MFNDDNENDDPIDLSLPFPADMTHCPGWNPGKVCFILRRKDDRKDLKDDPKDTV